MNIAVGDIVDLVVTKVARYACWGRAGDKTGFSHMDDWSEEKPIPRHLIPKVGETIKVRVFKLVTDPQSEVPLDVTHGRTIVVDFAGARSLVDQTRWDAFLKSLDSTLE